ncbi:DUF6597 domain-containing transcriptional factor [Actinomadura decatromicini]|uniref:DUF6597 domain-containing transcriptional factor n=1 Tax=Actinomadura decatromicini TaxID=2604572 RepID=UPI003CCC7EB6
MSGRLYLVRHDGAASRGGGRPRQRPDGLDLDAARALQCEDDVVESYVERPPLPKLAGVVRTVWIQHTGEAAYVQRHLPTGGVEIHFPIGGRPQLVGPLTGPEIEVLPAHTTIVGVRFQPGTAPPLNRR